MSDEQPEESEYHPPEYNPEFPGRYVLFEKEKNGLDWPTVVLMLGFFAFIFAMTWVIFG